MTEPGYKAAAERERPLLSGSRRVDISLPAEHCERAPFLLQKYQRAPDDNAEHISRNGIPLSATGLTWTSPDDVAAA